MRCTWLLAVVVFLAFALATEAAGTNDMVQFVKEYCDKQRYPGNNVRGDSPVNYGGDCAQFVARAIQAGACLPGASATDSIWDYAAYRAHGKTYKLICVGCGRCYAADGRTVMPGLNEYLRDAGWINRGTSYDAVDYGCAVIGNPRGPARGNCAHSAFGIGPRRIAAHTSDHCSIDVADVFESLQAVWCAPPRCQSCRCTPCQDCVNGQCVDKCSSCQVCDGQRCVAKCDAGNCEVCEGGHCRQTCTGCSVCRGGRCVDDSAGCNKCQTCQGARCVDNPAKVNCGNKCTQCNPATGNCDTLTATARGCDGCQFCEPTTGQCNTDTAKFTNCYTANKCATCDPANGQCKLDPAKTNCANKCKACNPATGGCDAETAVATQCKNDKCSFCDPADGACKLDPVKNSCENKCLRCNSADGTCSLPTATALSCNPCQRCNPTTGKCEKNPDICANDKCFDCHPGEGGNCTLPRDAACAVDKCFKCDANTGTCDMPRNLTCVANKCYKCDSADGQCIKNSDIKCNPCQICDPATGTCVDAGNCNKCSKCVVKPDNVSFTCEPIVDKCKACEFCDIVTGECNALKCSECYKCDAAANECVPNPDAACGADTECNKCDATGRCAPLEDVSCSSAQNASVCQEAKCVSGKCSLKPNAAAANALECGPAGQCFSALCQADGSCKKIPKPENTTCSEVAIDQCNVGMCDATGACIQVPLSNVSCVGPASTNKNVTLCQQAICENGKCVSVPRPAGTNCTHRINETDETETPCVWSLCDGNGMCVANVSSPFCVVTDKKKNKSKATAAIVGGVVGGVVLAGAAVAVGIFVAAKASPTLAAGMGLDPALSNAAVNPTYVQMADTSSLLYGQG